MRHMTGSNLRLNILYVIDYLYGEHGGTEGQLLQIMRNLDWSRFDPALCCLWQARGGERIEIPHFHLFQGPVRWRSTLSCLYRLWRVIRAARFDIVHTFFPTSNILGVLAARLARVPVIVASRRDLGYWKRWRDRVLLRAVGRIPTCTLANSHEVKRCTARCEGVNPKKITVIHGGVDLDFYCGRVEGQAGALKMKQGVPQGNLIVGVVANYHRTVKGLHYFVGAAKLVSMNMQNVWFFVVGRGERDQDERLRNRLCELGLEARFVFTGPQRDVRPFLSLFDVAVLPSLSEGFSNSLLEYMAAGLPCVATDVGGNKELVVDGETGFLVKPASAQALAEKTIVLLRNPGLREKMGRMAQERVRTHFSMTKMIRELETLYEHLYLCSSRAKAAARRGFGPSGGGRHRRAFPNPTGET